MPTMTTPEPTPSKFAFHSGDKPVTGYTIRRPIHRGGFGEVYYAVSDSGKEVALKLLQHYQETELRGITQCLNFKHPNLVSLFDIRTDADGDRWVIMEYIRGGSLDDVLKAFPNGLPRDEVQAWLRGLVAGVTHLHQNGLVHRDLKPGNVFRENGVVKVGDVGLSKQLGSDRRGQHTESVGTVYYMAPEVAQGRYGPELDVYSVGVMLYEMLTGRLPFEGETTAEILMKHLTAAPDLSLLPAEVRPAIGRALHKDPGKRTPTLKQLEREFLAGSGPERLDESAFMAAEGETPRVRSRKTVEINCGERPVFSVNFEKSEGPRNRAANRQSPGRHPDIARPSASSGWGRWLILGGIVLFLWGAYPSPYQVTLGAMILGVYLIAHLVRRWKLPPHFATHSISDARNGELALRQAQLASAGLIVPVGCVLGMFALAAYQLFSPKQVQWAPELTSMVLAVTIVGALALWATRLMVGESQNWPRGLSLALGAFVGTIAYGLDQFLLVDLGRSYHLWPSAWHHLGVHRLVTGEGPTWLGYCVFFGGFFALRNWKDVMATGRWKEWQFGSLFLSFLVAWLVTALFDFPQLLAFFWAITITATVQLCSPWQRVNSYRST